MLEKKVNMSYIYNEKHNHGKAMKNSKPHKKKSEKIIACSSKKKTTTMKINGYGRRLFIFPS